MIKKMKIKMLFTATIVFMVGLFLLPTAVLAGGACLCRGQIGLNWLGEVVVPTEQLNAICTDYTDSVCTIIDFPIPSEYAKDSAECNLLPLGTTDELLAKYEVPSSVTMLLDTDVSFEAACRWEELANGVLSPGMIGGPDLNGVISENMEAAGLEKITPAVPVSKNGCPGGYTCLTNPLDNKKADIPFIIGTVIKSAMGLAGALALFMVIWGAQGWLLAAGNPEKIKEGSKTIIWAIVGLLVLFMAYLVLAIVLNTLTTGVV